jgi:phage baseplate assembly protein W
MVSGYTSFVNNSGTIKYTDLDLSFLPNPNTSDLRVKTDVDAIRQSINILLFTNSGERPFSPNLAGNLDALLFEPLDFVTTILLQRNIVNTLIAYEPRIAIVDVKVSTPSDPNTINITISFRILNTPNVQTIQIERKR